MAALIRCRAASSCSSVVALPSKPTVTVISAVRTLFVRAANNPVAALDKLATKSELDGLEKQLMKRRRYIKKHLERQQNARDAVYNKAKQQRLKLVEELLLKSPL